MMWEVIILMDVNLMKRLCIEKQIYLLGIFAQFNFTVSCEKKKNNCSGYLLFMMCLRLAMISKLPQHKIWFAFLNITCIVHHAEDGFCFPSLCFRLIWCCMLHSLTWSHLNLTHWGQDKMAVFSQTTFSNAFCSMKMFEFRLHFHWSLF